MPLHLKLRMAIIPLSDFIATHRDEIISHCVSKVAARSEPPRSPAECDHGVPLLLSQLVTELRRGTPTTHDISESAREHGHDLLVRGFTIDQAVRNYGDVCQAVTQLAVETHTPISAEDFRTLNQCLDDAIAGAVTEFAREQDISRDGELSELWSLVNSAGVAFEALQSGRVGIGGATAEVVRKSLAALRAYVDRREINAAREAGQTITAAGASGNPAG